MKWYVTKTEILMLFKTLSYGKFLMVFLSGLFMICFVGRAQENTTIKYPKRIISKIKLLLGSSIIYPRGSKSFNNNRSIKMGFSGGLGITHVVNPNFQISFNLLFETKGSKANFKYLNTDFNPPTLETGIPNLTLNYITGSLIPKYLFGNQRIFVGCGPYIGYLLSMRKKIETYRNGTLVNISGSRPDPYSSYKKYDFGFKGLVVYSIIIDEKMRGNIQLNGNIGLSNANQPNFEKFLNSTFSLLVGYALNKV